MPENLGQGHEVVLVVGQELMAHRMAEDMRVQLDPGDGAIFVAQGTHAPIRQRPPLAHEDLAGLHRRSGV